ncbi:hypothetical protein IM816_05665 [Luteibacter flocculans]|uniref:DUF1059 domain-containing protein n=1 Tax=Luteibacter flocculans TaxID=2780091 RepID=A0ABY4T3V8_9GAMM|nr:hypothetical protein [Luteibacter flocculans]URL59583.1 hypothetical protein IM816_05665 [Luteibacter flocculans]
MSTIKITVHASDLGCKLELTGNMDKNAEFVAQFDSIGEAAEQAVVDLAEKIGAQLRKEYDKRDAINQRVKELGA